MSAIGQSVLLLSHLVANSHFLEFCGLTRKFNSFTPTLEYPGARNHLEKQVLALVAPRKRKQASTDLFNFTKSLPEREMSFLQIRTAQNNYEKVQLFLKALKEVHARGDHLGVV